MAHEFRKRSEPRLKKKLTGSRANDLAYRIENLVANTLELMVEENLIDSYIRYAPGTPKKDFQITIGGSHKEVNVTISQRVWRERHQLLFPEVVTLYLHPDMQHRRDEVIKRIIRLFN